jgi:hypothetical protein
MAWGYDVKFRVLHKSVSFVQYGDLVSRISHSGDGNPRNCPVKTSLSMFSSLMHDTTLLRTINTIKATAYLDVQLICLTRSKKTSARKMQMYVSPFLSRSPGQSRLPIEDSDSTTCIVFVSSIVSNLEACLF